MKANQESHVANLRRGQRLMAAGSLLAGLAATSCCILPLVLFSIGVSGAWIGTFTQLAPYQPFFVGATVACLACGYWLVYRSSKIECAEGEPCAWPFSNWLVRLGLIVATVLVVGAIGFDLVAPLLL